MTPTQLALAWVLHLGSHVCAVAGPRSETQIAELFSAFEIRLTPQQTAWLNLEADPP